MDRREEILKQERRRDLSATDHSAILNAMDEYMKECCLELLSYIGDKCICFDYDVFGQLQFQLKGGHWITKEQLFENFL